MDLTDAIAHAANGMKAQGTRMRVISENIANADSTAQTEDGKPYTRKTVTFKSELNKATHGKTIAVDKVIEDKDSNYVLKYEPSHPAANKEGYVEYPNVNPLIEMMDLKEAQRSYEANLGTIQVSKSMLNRTLDLLDN